MAYYYLTELCTDHELAGPLKFDEAEKTSDPPLATGSQKISMCIELTTSFFPFNLKYHFY